MAAGIDTHVTSVEAWLAAWPVAGDLGPARDAVVARAVRALAATGPEAQPAVPLLVRVAHADPRGLGELVGHALGEIGGALAVREVNHAWSFIEFFGGFADAPAVATALDSSRIIARDDPRFSDTRRRATDAVTCLHGR